MNELQTLESIIKDAPDQSWDTFDNERYYRRCGDKWFVWLYHTEVWSVPICNPPVDFMNRKDIEKQIDQLKEIKRLKNEIGHRNTQLETIAEVLIDEITEKDAPNFCGWIFDQENKEYEVTVRRKNGQSSMEQLGELREQLANANSELTQLSVATLNAVQSMSGGKDKANLRDAYDKASNFIQKLESKS
jgi:hypothetical protein